jgi:hypothetical protein
MDNPVYVRRTDGPEEAKSQFLTSIVTGKAV